MIITKKELKEVLKSLNISETKLEEHWKHISDNESYIRKTSKRSGSSLDEEIKKWICEAEAFDIERSILIPESDTNLLETEEFVLSLNDAYLSCEFAEYVNGANIKAHENIVVNSGVDIFILEFAEYVNGADVSRLQDAIIKCENPDCICSFAERVNGADVKKISDYILASGDTYYNYRFAKNIKNVDTYAHIETALKNMNYDSFVISVDMDGNVKKAKTKTKK